jgi:hypothetical protein
MEIPILSPPAGGIDFQCLKSDFPTQRMCWLLSADSHFDSHTGGNGAVGWKPRVQNVLDLEVLDTGGRATSDLITRRSKVQILPPQPPKPVLSRVRLSLRRSVTFGDFERTEDDNERQKRSDFRDCHRQ